MDKRFGEFDEWRTWAIYGGMAVYGGALILALMFNESLIASAFGPGLMGWIARVGVALVALNGIALPFALHFYAVEGAHRAAAMIAYGIDLLLIIVNAVASYDSLANGAMPDWVAAYIPYAPATLLFAMVVWGVLWMLDPGNRALIEFLRAKQEGQLSVMRRASEYLQSRQGQAAIEEAAAMIVAGTFNSRALAGDVADFDPVLLARIEEALRRSSAAHNPNPNGHREEEVNPTSPPRSRG